MRELHCDLCLGGVITWEWPVRTFEMTPGYNSLGNWGFCEDCHDVMAQAVICQMPELLPRRYLEVTDHSDLDAATVEILHAELLRIHTLLLANLDGFGRRLDPASRAFYEDAPAFFVERKR